MPGLIREYAPNDPGQPQAFLPPTSGTGNGLPIFDWDQAAAQLNRGGWSWSATLATPLVVTYAFRATLPPDPDGNMPSVVSGFQPFNATQIAVTEEILQLWAEVTNITFVRVGSGTSGAGAYSDNASILFGNFVNGPPQFSAFTFLPSPEATGAEFFNGDVWVNISRDYDANPAAFPFGGHILAHEIGHALGLLHPGDYGGGGASGNTYQNNAEYYQDTLQYTNMSYFGEAPTGASLPTNSITPMMHDIAAAQMLYGVNTTTRTGDTVYGFNSNTGHAAFTIASAPQPAVFCIWDAGGNDTLDLSGYTTNSEIDLRPESFSSAGVGGTYNISIAKGVTIENAIGGTGADTIIGNSVANTLTGGNGNDIITGGGGADTLIGGVGVDRLSGEAGNDIIFWDAMDNPANIQGGSDFDILVFTTIGAAPTTFDLTAHGFEQGEGRFTDTGANAWATESDYYDTSWRLDVIVVSNDDASHSVLDLDQASAFTWASAWAGYDTLGRLDTDVLTYDNNSRAVRDLDQANAFSWSTTWAGYTSGGLLDVDIFTYDNGSQAVRDLDQANAFNWATAWASYDSLGRLDTDVLTYDDGSYAVRDLDQADAFAWAQMWWLYNSGGQLIAHQTTNDDGSVS